MTGQSEGEAYHSIDRMLITEEKHMVVRARLFLVSLSIMSRFYFLISENWTSAPFCSAEPTEMSLFCLWGLATPITSLPQCFSIKPVSLHSQNEGAGIVRWWWANGLVSTGRNYLKGLKINKFGVAVCACKLSTGRLRLRQADWKAETILSYKCSDSLWLPCFKKNTAQLNTTQMTNKPSNRV